MKFTWKCKIQGEDGQSKEREVTAGWSPDKVNKDEVSIVACIQENVKTGMKHQPLGPATLVGKVEKKTQAGALSLVPA
jgi:hypothetical protein